MHVNTTRGHVSLSHETVDLKVLFGVNKLILRHMFMPVGSPRYFHAYTSGLSI